MRARTMLEISPETRQELNRHLTIINGERAKLSRAALSLRQYADVILTSALPSPAESVPTVETRETVYTRYVEYTPES
jgi:hypothetical protein